MSDKDQYENQIAISLSQLARMQGYNIVHGESWKDKSNGEKIFFLHQMDFSPEDIALIVGTTIGTVRKEISIRKSKS